MINKIPKQIIIVDANGEQIQRALAEAQSPNTTAEDTLLISGDTNGETYYNAWDGIVSVLQTLGQQLPKLTMAIYTGNYGQAHEGGFSGPPQGVEIMKGYFDKNGESKIAGRIIASFNQAAV